MKDKGQLLSINKTVRAATASFFVIGLLIGGISFSTIGNTLLPNKNVNNLIILKEDSRSQSGSIGGDDNLYPIITTDISTDSVTLEIIFSSLEIRYENNYHVLESSGCYLTADVGLPRVPAKSFYILLPAGASVKGLQILDHTTELEHQYYIESTPVPSINGDSQQNSYRVSVDSSDPYPEEIFQINGIYKFRGYKLLGVTAYAAQYFSSSYKVIQMDKITVELTLERHSKETPYSLSDDSLDPLYRGLPEDEDAVMKLVVNPTTVSTYPLKTPLMARYKYVIITSSSLITAFQPLQLWKQGKVGSANIVTVSYITSNYDGVDTPEKIRNFIIDAYNSWTTDWILLGGDVEIVPYRGCYAKVYTSSGWEIDQNIPCDLYYSDLDGDWNADGDGIYGETSDNVDLFPDVFVGRAPVNTVAEATNFVTKVLTYEQNPPSNYLLNALMIAYWLDSSTNEAVLKNAIADTYLTDYTVTKEYEPSNGAGVPKAVVIGHLNSGQGLVNHMAHSNQYSTPPLGISDVNSLSNGDKYFIFYSAGCTSNKFEHSDAIAEHFILNTNGGAVAYIGNSRYGWYYSGSPGNGPSDAYDKEFYKKLFAEGYDHIGETLAMSKQTYIPSSGSDGAYRWIQYCLNLLGDPEMRIWTEEPQQQLTIPLYYGWNLITVPFENTYMASTLAAEITGCEVVSRWDAINQTYRSYVTDGPPGLDFEIKNGHAYFILVTENSEFSLDGGTTIASVSVPLSIGWNMIGWYHAAPTTASTLGGSISGCEVISRWDGVNQTYRSYIVGGPPGLDYTITRGMGLFVLVNEASTWDGEG